MTSSNDNGFRASRGRAGDTLHTRGATVHIGLRAKVLRETAGMTSEEAAIAIGIPRTELEQAEAGAVRLSPDRLARLAALLNVRVQDFFASD